MSFCWPFPGPHLTPVALPRNLKRPALFYLLSSLGTKPNTPLSSRSRYLSPLCIAPSSSHFLLSNHWFFRASIKYLQCVGRLLSLGVYRREGGSFWKSVVKKEWRSRRGGKARGEKEADKSDGSPQSHGVNINASLWNSWWLWENKHSRRCDV